MPAGEGAGEVHWCRREGRYCLNLVGKGRSGFSSPVDRLHLREEGRKRARRRGFSSAIGFRTHRLGLPS
jgi:hypothetical protein